MNIETIIEKIDSMVYNILELDKDYDRSRDYIEYGAQSLSLMKFQAQIAADFSVKLKFRDLVKYGSTERLAKYLFETAEINNE